MDSLHTRMVSAEERPVCRQLGTHAGVVRGKLTQRVSYRLQLQPNSRCPAGAEG